MFSQATKTTETTYEYDDTGVMTKKRMVETDDVAVPSITTVYTGNDNAEIETGIELESAIEMSPLEVFMAAAVGALVGNLLYRVIRKN